MPDRDSLKPCIYVDCGNVEYESAWRLQKELVQLRRQSVIPDILILLRHPHTITLGRSGNQAHLLADPAKLRRRGVALVHSDRGGDITYHGPGQLVGYPILDLAELRKDIFWYLRQLEQVIIDTLGQSKIQAGRKAGLTGVWVGEAKIAAIGVKVSHWITSHGFAFNIDPRIDLFELIVPCGIDGKAVTSVAALSGQADFLQLTNRLVEHFGRVFNRGMMPYNHASWPALQEALQAEGLAMSTRSIKKS